jgi:hypothetical protein
VRGETSSAQALPHSNHMRDGADLGAERAEENHGTQAGRTLFFFFFNLQGEKQLASAASVSPHPRLLNHRVRPFGRVGGVAESMAATKPACRPGTGPGQRLRLRGSRSSPDPGPWAWRLIFVHLFLNTTLLPRVVTQRCDCLRVGGIRLLCRWCRLVSGVRAPWGSAAVVM